MVQCSAVQGFAVASELVSKGTQQIDTEPPTKQVDRHPYSPQGRPFSIQLPSSSAFVLPKPPRQPRWSKVLRRLARGAATLLTAAAFHQVHASCSQKRQRLQTTKSPNAGLLTTGAAEEDDTLLLAEDGNLSGTDDEYFDNEYAMVKGLKQQKVAPHKAGLVDAVTTNLDKIVLATGFTICVAV